MKEFVLGTITDILLISGLVLVIMAFIGKRFKKIKFKVIPVGIVFFLIGAIFTDWNELGKAFTKGSNAGHSFVTTNKN